MPRTLFGRVTRYSRSPSLDPHENRLTEVTAAVFENVEGLARDVIKALLVSARDAARQQAATEREDAPSWCAEATRYDEIIGAVDALTTPRTRVQTQVTTPKGRFVDMEVWLRPTRPADLDPDVVIWFEVKDGSDIHGDQLDVYLQDIEAHRAAHSGLLLLAPRGQVFASTPPQPVGSVDWQSVGVVVREWVADSELPAEQRWLVAQYAEYLREEGLMDPDALDAVQALALMELNEAEAAAAGISEVADAFVSSNWGTRTHQATPQGKSMDPDYGLGYWANYEIQPDGAPPPATWLGGWFECGLRNTDEFDYVDAEDLRGSNVFYAGATFEPRSDPAKVAGNEAWVNARLAEGFISCWFGGNYRLVRLKYPDELLASTTLEGQGESLGRWIVDAFSALASSAPPN